MRKIILVFCIIFLNVRLNGQTIIENLTGKVSFVSSQNIYVKLTSTAGISSGDTLYISSGGTLVPVLRVTNLSSTSCVCTSISTSKLSAGDQIIVKKKTTSAVQEETVVKKAEEVKDITVKVVLDTTAKKHYDSNEPKQKIRGSLSAYSYSDFSNTSAHSSARFRYNLSLDAQNIADSKFSVESYISFNHKLGDWDVVKNDVFNALKIYSLSVRYDLNKTTQISIGRRINPKISSIGAMDGLQIEKSINKFSLGALAGTRPGITDYGFDSKLIQYGAYLAFNTFPSNTYFESSLAFMQQTNSGKTDRRFLYFQQSNSLIKNLWFISTFEVDLYKLKSDSFSNYTPRNTFSLTGVYLSLRYKMTKKITLTGSYDERKNVMYYETYKSFIDRILESEIRHSLRLQADYRITNYLTLGLQSGYRFLKSDPRHSKNGYGYLTYSQIPGINVSLTLSATYLESSYLKSKIYGASVSRDFLQGKLYTTLGYHHMDYKYPEGVISIVQNIAEMNLSWQFAKRMSFSVNYEGTYEKQNKYNRVYLQIRKRF